MIVTVIDGDRDGDRDRDGDEMIVTVSRVFHSVENVTTMSALALALISEPQILES